MNSILYNLLANLIVFFLCKSHESHLTEEKVQAFGLVRVQTEVLNMKNSSLLKYTNEHTTHL